MSREFLIDGVYFIRAFQWYAPKHSRNVRKYIRNVGGQLLVRTPTLIRSVLVRP